MLNRLYNNFFDFDFARPQEKEEYHHKSISKLLRSSVEHPNMSYRLPSPNVPRWNSPELMDYWNRIEATQSQDHYASIVGIGEYEEFSADEMNGLIVFSTGGTTSAPKLLVNSYEETLHNAKFQGKGYRAAGITAEDTVMTFAGIGTFAANYCIYHALSSTGCTIVPIMNGNQVDENVDLMLKLNVSVLLSMPSNLFKYADNLESRAPTAIPRIRRIITGGEQLPQKLKERLTSIFGDTLKFRSTFQTADHGTIGFQCDDCDSNEFHIHEELQFVELLPCEESDGFLLATTNLYRYHMPVIKSLTGDIASWSDGEKICNCGRASRKIKLLGRQSDQLKIGGEKISVQFLKALPSELGISEDRFRVEIATSPDGLDQIDILLDKHEDNEMQKKILSYLCSDATMQNLVIRKQIAEFEFKGITDNSFFVSDTGKLTLVRDIRRTT